MSNLHDLLKYMIEKGASDLHISTGIPPSIRVVAAGRAAVAGAVGAGRAAHPQAAAAASSIGRR